MAKWFYGIQLFNHSTIYLFNMRLLFTTILLLNAFTLFCQTEKGSLLFNLNGNLNRFSYSSSASDNYFYGNYDTRIGFAFWGDLFIGVRYRPYYKIHFSGDSYFKIPSYGIFSKYYFLKNKNRIFLETDLNHGNLTSRFRQTKWNASIGFTHFFGKHTALEIQLSRNIYYKEFGDLFFSDPNDPIIFSTRRPEGIECTVGLNFFLPANRAKANKDSRIPLINRYLKKGNKFITATGTVDFEDISILGVFESSKFIRDNIRLQYRAFGWMVLGKKNNNGSHHIHTVSSEYFAQIGDRFYFTPLLGTGPIVNFNGLFKNTRLGWTGTAQIGFTYFLNNVKISLGNSLNSFDYFKKGSKMDFTYNLYLSSEIFLTDKLAINPIIYYNLTESSTFLFSFDENYRLVIVDKFRLQFGFSYYY